MTTKDEILAALNKCLDYGLSKEELVVILKRTSNNKLIDSRVERLVSDLLFDEMKTYRFYAELFEISPSRIQQYLAYIGRKAKWWVNRQAFETKLGELKKENKGEELIFEYAKMNGPLDARTVNALIRYGISTAKQLYEFNTDDFWKVRNLGRKCVQRIDEFKKMYEKIML